MISWDKSINIRINYKDLEDVNDKRKKLKEMTITNSKSKGLGGSYTTADAVLTIGDTEIVVEAEWMKEAMEKIIALKKI